MILCDAGPLYALVDKNQKASIPCRSTLAALSKPVITTWPCFTDAMYLCGENSGWSMQRLLWRYIEKNVVTFYTLTGADAARMLTLMEQYKDRPMDVADASLVAAAEALNDRRIFTLDSDFYIYRHRETGIFEVVPLI